MKIPPPIQTLIDAKLQENGPEAARNFFLLASTPNRDWKKKINPGVDAAQRVLDKYFEAQGENAEVPQIITLVNAELRGTPKDGRDFFGLARDPSKEWLKSIEPGIDAAQRVLSWHMSQKDSEEAPEPPQEDKEGLQLAPGEDDGIQGDTSSDETKMPPQPEEIPVEKPQRSMAEMRLIPMLQGLSDNPTSEEILTAVADGKWKRRVIILNPANRDLNPWVNFGLIASVMRQRFCGYDMEPFTDLRRARNILAHRFLQSEAEWSMWIDSDNIVPWLDSQQYFRDKFGADPNRCNASHFNVNGIERLLSHGKSLVGAIYRERRNGGQLVNQPSLHPANDQDKALAASMKQPQNKVVPVGYVATGVCLIHRRVYEDIMKAHPELARPDEKLVKFDFFGQWSPSDGGEDIHFCKLAKDAGHQSWLDLGLWCSHIGAHSYMP